MSMIINAGSEPKKNAEVGSSQVLKVGSMILKQELHTSVGYHLKK